jgi:hypothetical protein
MWQPGIHEFFALLDESEAVIERHGVSLRIHIHLPVVVARQPALGSTPLCLVWLPVRHPHEVSR